ncbi:MAG: adenylate/guanylate cyclase domain-containing protein [Thermoplasmata archaeon]
MAAIMFTDMVGFTAMSQRNEVVAMRLLDEHRAILRPVFDSHGGRVIKTMGDGFLVEFPSALESVICAQKVQQTLEQRNVLAQDEEKITLRIGIHVGEIIDQGDDIVGDAVNVAPRIEPLAEPGGICVSDQVLDQIRNKLPVSCEDVVAPKLKNVEFPIRVYRLHASVNGSKAPLPSREPISLVRLAVLPFTSMSPDPSDEFFADGLTEEMIACLSQSTALRIVARTSVMPYKGVRKGIREIGRELSVGSILEGSVRRSAKKVRIAVQLVDAGTEEHLWVSTFDREMDDVFAVQDEIAQSVSKVLQGKLVARTPPSWRNQRPRISTVPT